LLLQIVNHAALILSYRLRLLELLVESLKVLLELLVLRLVLDSPFQLINLFS